MTTIVALDLGTTTGWALHTADGNTVSGTQTFKPGRFALEFYGATQRWMASTADVSRGAKS